MAADLQKMEMIRRACFGNLRTLCQHRYGRELPDDDAGRETLFDLLVVASLARVDPAKKMTNVVELQAPWLDGEAETMIGNVERMPVSERWRIARTLGEHHQVTYAEHRGGSDLKTSPHATRPRRSWPNIARLGSESGRS